MNYNKADFIASYGISSQLPESDRPELSFSGRSNVGKSSLINKLCSRKNLARVSSTPGKTATINFYSVDDCYFVDLPGYGYAKVSNADRERWDDLINSYFEAPRHHTLLVQLLAGKSVDVPVLDMLLSLLKIVLIPVVIGVLANVWLHSLTARLEPLLPLVSMVAIVLIIATVVALNAGQFAAIGPIVALAVILHNGIGITAGYWVSRWLGFDERICRTIAFEVGLQNSGLATALAMKFFTPASAVAGTLFSVWHNLSGSLLAGFWARRPLLLAERQTGVVVKDH